MFRRQSPCYTASNLMTEWRGYRCRFDRQPAARPLLLANLHSGKPSAAHARPFFFGFFYWELDKLLKYSIIWLFSKLVLFHNVDKPVFGHWAKRNEGWFYSWVNRGTRMQLNRNASGREIEVFLFGDRCSQGLRKITDRQGRGPAIERSRKSS